MRLLLLLLAACTGGEGDTAPAAFPAPAGTWYAGDLHVHTSIGSNDTDGLGTMDALVAKAGERGLDFVFVTDHSNAAGSMDCETGDVEDCPNQGPETPALAQARAASTPDRAVWVGSELSPIQSLDEAAGPNGHVGCLPLAGNEGWDEAFIDRPPGSVTGAQALAQCHAVGGWAVVNHPDALATWIRWDETSDAYEALEVFNGGLRFDRQDAETVEQRWLPRVAAGEAVVAVGGSDCHRFGMAPGESPLDPALGYPTTWVFAASLDQVPAALGAGRVVVADPPSRLSVLAWDGAEGLAGPGQAVDGPASLRLQGTAGGPGLALQVLAAGSGELALDQPLEGDFDQTLAVGAGVWVARLWPADPDWGAGVAGVAVANPVTVR